MSDLEPARRLTASLETLVADQRASAGLSVAAVTAAGRRRRRRRRIASGLAAAAVVATAGSGAIAVVHRTHGSENAGVSDDTTPHYVYPKGWWDTRAEKLAVTLRRLLPDDVRVTEVELTETDRAPGESPVRRGSLDASLNGPGGPGSLQVLLYRPQPEGPDHLEPTFASRIHCEGFEGYCREFRDSSGAVVGRSTSSNESTVTFYEVARLGPDGGLVDLTTYNTRIGKPVSGVRVTAPTPPLTLDQLTRLARSSEWTQDRG